MAFLFKSSKKGHERSVPSREGTAGSQGSIHSNASRIAREEKGMAQRRATPTGSLHSLDNDAALGPGSPDRGHSRKGGSIDQTQLSDTAPRNGPQSNMNSSLYPWSQRRLTYTSTHPPPFPRYGAAVNSVSSKEGDIYLMGGLINSSTVKGDLWMIEAGGNMACYPIATTAEGPGPRVGHTSLLVGNAFIVYGGDTKIDESDVLDETLYLLNTSTRQWSRALPAGPRPSGRYGHSLNILGSKIFIFGGQVEGYFMNDLSAFDLNQLQMPNNRWEILIQGDSSPQIPAARTNHSVITYQDKMYLFGGTNGFQWFNDVWCYDPAINKWTQLDCIGYIPSPREGHAAAVVDDVMYIFGGRTEEGSDLGDLAAFRISSKRWYTFQNMGPSPSPRSGHSMTAVGKSIVTIGGEPSSATSAANDLGILYILDTTKIRYPGDTQPQQARQRVPQQARRPSLTGSGGEPGRQVARDGSAGPGERRTMGSPVTTGYVNKGIVSNGHKSPPPNIVDPAGPQSSRLPRVAGSPPQGPPPLGPTPPKPDASLVGRVRGTSVDRHVDVGSPKIQSPTVRETSMEAEVGAVNGQRTPTQQHQGSPTPRQEPATYGTQGIQPRSKESVDSPMEPSLKGMQRPTSPPVPTRQLSTPLSRRSSGRNSQTVVLLKELDSSRNRNAWYASELELARKAGYTPSNNLNAVLDTKVTETFDDEERPLIEALLAMRTELANVQASVDKQAVLAAKHIAEAEKQRDAAIQEAVYARAKLAAVPGSSAELERGSLTDRSQDMSKKLATAFQQQKEAHSRLDTAKVELEAERKARQLADDTLNAAQKRMADLESYKQQTSGGVESLKAELHRAQREVREHSVASAEALASLELLKVEKQAMEEKYTELSGLSQGRKDTFDSLKAAIVAAEDVKSLLEHQLGEERAEREMVEARLIALKAEHETRTAELEAATHRLKDAEELAEKHASEAQAHRAVVMSGFDKIALDNQAKSTSADGERIAALQAQINSSNALIKKYQQEVDIAADKLRSAEERIAGLEQYQEQSSREGVGIRRQLQSALRDTQGLQAANTDLKNQLAAQQLETNAMTIQLTALKDILGERGISPTAAIARSRGLTGSRTASPDLSRVRELESQLASANTAHAEAKQAYANQAQESEAMYREKLSQLEGDYQSAVHYVKGTEKMLKQLKDQLSRYKTENGHLKSSMADLEDKMEAEGLRGDAAAGWEAERSALHNKVERLEAELRNASTRMQKDLDSLKTDLNLEREETAQKLNTQMRQLEQMRAENAILEQRANDAEQKVSLLLDQVEHSVDNYRRQSRQGVGIPTNGLGHVRNESSEVESVYGGNSDARNSAALDNLASELETLRTHWEATSKNYRLSTNLDLEPTAGKRDDGDEYLGLSESLADWRKKLDAEEHGGPTTSTNPRG